jgi:hypothetical protein
MAAYVVTTRERTRNAAQMEQYKQLAPASFHQHPAIFRAIHGRHEVLEGPAAEEIIILEFPRRGQGLVPKSGISGRMRASLPGSRLPFHHHRGPGVIHTMQSLGMPFLARNSSSRGPLAVMANGIPA